MKRLSIKEKAKKRKKKGFTLIELIIVIAIIAILAAIAIPKFGAIRQSANIKADIATAKNIQTAVATRIAEGKIKPGDKVDDDKYEDLLDGGKVPQSKAVPNTAFSVDAKDNGDIVVSVGKDEVYPTPSGTFS